MIRKSQDINLKTLDKFIYLFFLNKELEINGWYSEYSPVEGILYWKKGVYKVDATPFFECDTDMCVTSLDIKNHRYDYVRTVNLQNWYMDIRIGRKSIGSFLVYYMSVMKHILIDEHLMNIDYND